MLYEDRFELVDQYIDHLERTFPENQDAFIASRYVGFVAVSAVTVYEQAIKEIFIEFSSKKNSVFGKFAASYFIRINGRISSRVIVHEYLPRFGDKYVRRFKRMREEKEREILRSEGKSILTSYNNIITWRNQFAHEGVVPNTVTFSEVKDAYDSGKHIVHCLAQTMVR